MEISTQLNFNTGFQTFENMEGFVQLNSYADKKRIFSHLKPNAYIHKICFVNRLPAKVFLCTHHGCQRQI